MQLEEERRKNEELQAEVRYIPERGAEGQEGVEWGAC